MRIELLRLNIRKAEQDMDLDQKRYFLTLIGIVVTLVGLAFTAGSYFTPVKSSPTINVFTAERGTNS